MAYNVRINGQDKARFIKGEDVTWTLQFYDDETYAPTTLTGMTVTMILLDSNSAKVEIPCSALDNNYGKMTVDIPAAQTGVMQSRPAPHSIQFKIVKASKTNFINKAGVLYVDAPLFG